MPEQHVRIKRDFAEWMEDAFVVVIPDGATITDDDLLAGESVNDLYCVAMEHRGSWAECELDTEAGDNVVVRVCLEWENENHRPVEMLDDEWEISDRWSEPEPRDPWEDDPEFPFADWVEEVSANNTRLGYVDWVQHRREAERETPDVTS